MPILINEYHQDHILLPHAWMQDERLSYKARGLLAYLHTLPRRGRFDAQSLADKSPNGRRAILSGLKELRTLGYIATYRKRLENGKHACYNHLVCDPDSAPKSKVRETALFNSAKTAPLDRVVPILIGPSQDPPACSPEDWRKVLDMWEQNMPGTLTPINADNLHALVVETCAKSVIEGIKIAVTNGVRKMSYVAACARRTESGEGAPDRQHSGNSTGSVNPIFIN